MNKFTGQVRRAEINLHRWEYYDGGDWRPFPERTTNQIEGAFETSARSVRIDNPRGGTMEIDLASMQPSTPSNPSSMKIRRVSNKSQADTIYEWRDDGNKWKPYDTSTCEMLRIAQTAGRSSVVLFMGANLSYLVDFSAMNQTNQRTGFPRAIRTQHQGLVASRFVLTPTISRLS